MTFPSYEHIDKEQEEHRGRSSTDASNLCQDTETSVSRLAHRRSSCRNQPPYCMLRKKFLCES